MGAHAASQAQFLKGPITTFQRLRENPDQRIYFIRDVFDEEKLDSSEGVYYMHLNAVKENVPESLPALTQPTDKVFHDQLNELKHTAFHNAQGENVACAC